MGGGFEGDCGLRAAEERERGVYSEVSVDCGTVGGKKDAQMLVRSSFRTGCTLCTHSLEQVLYWDQRVPCLALRRIEEAAEEPAELLQVYP